MKTTSNKSISKKKKDKIHLDDLIESMPVVSLMDSLGEGVIATCDNGNMCFVNTCGQEMFAMKEKDMVGKRFNDIFSVYDKSGEMVPREKFLIRRVLKSGRKLSESGYYFTAPNRKKFPAAVTTSPIKIDGKLSGTVSIFRNMRKEVEIDKAKTEFVSLASHQLRTPLTAIKLFTEILLSMHSKKQDEEKRSILTSIEQCNEKMIRLVNDLLNVATIEAGKLRVLPMPISVDELVSDVLAEVSPLAFARDITIDTTVKEWLGNGVNHRLAVTDPNLLKQVLNNIITNAIEYSPNNTKIKVQVTQDDKKYYEIHVRDQGIGISKGSQKEVFNRFFRAKNAIKFKTESSGLGLYVAKMMMEAIGGRIKFITKEGKGTTFSIRFPMTVSPDVFSSEENMPLIS